MLLKQIIEDLRKFSHDKVHVESLTAQLESLVSGTVLLNQEHTRQLLQALNGGGHLIRELQVLRGFPDNPITNLIEQYNAQVE